MYQNLNQFKNAHFKIKPQIVCIIKPHKLRISSYTVKVTIWEYNICETTSIEHISLL